MNDFRRTPSVSIVLVSHNDEASLKQCLKSIVSQTYGDYEVILVDNGSKDRSVEVARELFPDVRVLRLGKNYGLTAAYNIGLRVARGRYLVTMHNDVIVDKAWLESLVKAMKSHPQYVLLGSAEATPEIPYHTYVDMNAWFSYVRFRADENVVVVPTAYVSGTSLFFRRELLEALGKIFDERLGTYAYDDEISLKALLSLGLIGYSTRSKIFHYGGGTASRVVSVKRAAYLRSRNRVFVLFECLSLKNFIKALAVLLMLELIRFLTRPKDFLGNVYTFSGTVSGIVMLLTLLNKRREFLYKKTKDDKDLIRRLRVRTRTQRLIKLFLVG
ncbi:MAG: glycosyltransferase family 2 protein [Nitrososphaerota archaeon]